jgi:valyl-tRNA synthetase
VRDKNGLKISKSKGNVINPIEMTEKYGADALRMGLLWGGLIENDIALSEEKINGQRKFANKVWNVARFVSAQYKVQGTKYKVNGNVDDKWILGELKETTKKVTKALDKFRLNEASEKIYDFVWHKFADIYLEKVKEPFDKAQGKVTVRKSSVPVLNLVLNSSLKLLHPFMPFVTEQIWSEMGNKDLLITAEWPASKS